MKNLIKWMQGVLQNYLNTLNKIYNTKSLLLMKLRVLLKGIDAEQFNEKVGFELVMSGYFIHY